MSTAWVECWKCDECGWRWIKTETWPERCPSRGCRKRSWNHNSGDGARQTHQTAGADKGLGQPSVVQVSNPAPPTISSIQPVKMNPAMAKFMDQVRIEVPIEELAQPVPEVRYCLNTTCESVLRLVKGKLVCMDQSCGMLGIDQKGRA